MREMIDEVVISISAAEAGNAPAITKWPRCELLGKYNFEEEPKIMFLLKLFTRSQGAANSLKWTSYDCGIEGMAGLMIKKNSPCTDSSKQLCLKYESNEIHSDYKDVATAAATSMKTEIEKIRSETRYGCNYEKNENMYAFLCLFMK